MKHQSYIRSLFVAFCAFFVCASALAETYLNPFAYRLDNMEDRNTGITDDSKGLLMNDHYVIKYALSGPATSVIVRFWDDANSTWSRDGGNTGSALFEFDITDKKLRYIQYYNNITKDTISNTIVPFIKANVKSAKVITACTFIAEANTLQVFSRVFIALSSFINA